MGRKLRLISNFELQKCDKNNAEVSTSLLPIKKNRKEHYADKDRMSPLPDEILVCILSCLIMKDAARTSVLSRRWRHLWTFYTGSLNFDCSRRVVVLRGVIHPPKSMLQFERLSFVGWVNLVLKSNQGSIIDELKVCFDLDSKSFKCDIDSWVKFAIEKRVSRLHLDLTRVKGSKLSGRYSFPSHLLNRSSFRSLTALCLIYIDVSGEVIEDLLSNCSLLEVLRIVHSLCLVSLKVCHNQSPSLKYLEIGCCHKLVNLEVSAANLVSFRYGGPNIAILIKNVPRLVEVSFGGFYNENIIQSLSQLSCYIPQLETIALDTIFTHELLDFQLPDKIPLLSNLKHLKLGISLRNVHCLLPCTYLLKASPFLCDLTLEIQFVETFFKDVRKLIKDHPHQCLKVLKLVGFQGVIAEVDVVMYFVENAVLLEKIIIEPYKLPYVFDYVPEKVKLREIDQLEKQRLAAREKVKFMEIENCRLARLCARDLGAKLPQNIEFVLV